MEIDFDPIRLELVWDRYGSSSTTTTTTSSAFREQGATDASLSMDRAELQQITATHLEEALMAELRMKHGVDVARQVQAGVPSLGQEATRELVLPLELQGSATVQENTVGTESLTRILQTAFTDANANSLYLFRLRRAADPTLKVVAEVRMGRASGMDENMPPTTVTSSNNNDDAFLSTLLIAIIASVAAAIIAVLCFVYCLLCRNGGGSKYSSSNDESESSQWADESSAYDVEKGGGSIASSRFSITRNIKSKKQSYANRKKARQSRNVDHVLPQVQTAPTDESNENTNVNGVVIDYAESEISASVMDGTNNDSNTITDQNTLGGEVSELGMETLASPPSVQQVMPDYGQFDDDDDDDDMTMSLVGYVPDHSRDEDVESATEKEEDAADDDQSEAPSLYSYIPDDTSLATYNNHSVMQDTALSRLTIESEKQQKSQQPLQETAQKGLLWSVMDTLKRYDGGDGKSDTVRPQFFKLLLLAFLWREGVFQGGNSSSVAIVIKACSTTHVAHTAARLHHGIRKTDVSQERGIVVIGITTIATGTSQ